VGTIVGGKDGGGMGSLVGVGEGSFVVGMGVGGAITSRQMVTSMLSTVFVCDQPEDHESYNPIHTARAPVGRRGSEVDDQICVK